MNQTILIQQQLMEKALDILERIKDIKFFFERTDKKYSDERCVELQHDYADVMALLFENLASVDPIPGIVSEIQQAVANGESILALAIKNAIDNNRPDESIIKTCLDNITDNELAMKVILGDTLVEKIKALKV